MYRIYYTVFNNEGENQGNFLLYKNFSDINKAISKANNRKNIFRDKILSITIKEHDLQDITYEKTVYRDVKALLEIIEYKYSLLSCINGYKISCFLKDISLDERLGLKDIYDHLTDEEITGLLIKYGDYNEELDKIIDSKEKELD